MAETTAKPTTTRPSRARNTAPKSAPAKAAPAAAPERVAIELEYAGDTSRYAKFIVPSEPGVKGSVAGKIYAPLGTKMVKVLVVGDESTTE